MRILAAFKVRKTAETLLNFEKTCVKSIGIKNRDVLSFACFKV